MDKTKEDGEFYESKLLWALGNFSRFIRPGARLVPIAGFDPTNVDGQAAPSLEAV